MSRIKVWKKEGIDFFYDLGYIPSLKELLNLSFQDGTAGETIFTMQDCTQYFIKKQNKIIAIVSVCPKGGKNRKGKSFSNMIYNVATHPDYRKKGYMRKIFERIKKDFTELNLEVFTSNEDAIRFYQKQGFKIESTLWFWFSGSSYMMRFKKSV